MATRKGGGGGGGSTPSPAALVIAPTRELALQTHAECERYGGPAGAAAVCVYGGAPMGEQKAALQRKKAPGGIGMVVVATPGRLCDLMKQGSLSLAKCRHMVLDEADRMLDMGFEPQLKEIFAELPPSQARGSPTTSTRPTLCSDEPSPRVCVSIHLEGKSCFDVGSSACSEGPWWQVKGADDGGRQTLMFTATWPKAIRKIAEQFMAAGGDGDGGPVKIFVGGGDGDGADLAANKAVSQRFILATDDEKDKHLYNILCELKEGSRVVAFANTKRRVEMLAKTFYGHGFGTCAVHGRDSPSFTSHFNLSPLCHCNHPAYLTADAYVELESGGVQAFSAWRQAAEGSRGGAQTVCEQRVPAHVRHGRRRAGAGHQGRGVLQNKHSLTSDMNLLPFFTRLYEQSHSR
jgi:superfamily II DNA/RNA helicase